jgi:DNA-binding transcriptional LysR family regulator
VRTHHPGVELHLCDADARSLRKRLLGGDLEAAIYALPSNVPDEEVHSLPLFQEQMVMAVHLNHRLANQRSVRVTDMSNETYIHRNNCEFAGYADAILAEQGVTVSPVYWSDRDDWTLAMIAAGLGFGFMPEHTAKHPGVVPLPITDPEFWREVNLVTVRGRRHSPAVGALVREATQKKWFGERAKALSAAE